MRNEIAYQAYMGFLLKSLFWISLIALISIVVLFLIDGLFFFFFPREKANVIRADIAPIGKRSKFIDAHGVFITYSFIYKNQQYTCQNLNSYGRVTVNGYFKALSIINNNIIDKQITVYICPFNPDFSIVLPFKGLTALTREISIIFLGCLIPARLLGYI